MAESVMVNVRLKSSEVARIDAAADKMKMSRSAFIRDALTKALAQVGDGTTVTGVKVRGKASKQPKQAYPYEDCPKGQYCQWVKAPTGIQICTTCGLKKA